MSIDGFKVPIPSGRIVTQASVNHETDDTIRFDVSRNLKFSTTALESYAFARWNPAVFDAMVLAAVVEFADKVVARPRLGWARRLHIQVPVHDPDRWNEDRIALPLHDALGFLTGDFWNVEFVRRQQEIIPQANDLMDLSVETDTVMAFSNGLDSRATAGLLAQELGSRLIRVRVGSRQIDKPVGKKGREPFTSVPYSVRCVGKETSARSRGFKFAMVTAIAAYLTGAKRIAIPESGQGAIGPAILTVGHAYPDYRNHPTFTRRMERFVNALFENSVEYVFPRLWSTKGETLRAYCEISADESWRATRSCWRGSQWSSVDGKLRQCGGCAACMLRRLSVHAAGLSEPDENYVCGDLSAATLDDSISSSFKQMNEAFEQYALAGVLHLDHFADLARPEAINTIARHALLLGRALRTPPNETESKLRSLVERHGAEWIAFQDTMGERSFVRAWTRAA